MAVIELDFKKKEQEPESFGYPEKKFLVLFRRLSLINRGRLLGIMEDFLIEQSFPNDD